MLGTLCGMRQGARAVSAVLISAAVSVVLRRRAGWVFGVGPDPDRGPDRASGDRSADHLGHAHADPGSGSGGDRGGAADVRCLQRDAEVRLLEGLPRHLHQRLRTSASRTRRRSRRSSQARAISRRVSTGRRSAGCFCGSRQACDRARNGCAGGSHGRRRTARWSIVRCRPRQRPVVWNVSLVDGRGSSVGATVLK